LAGKSVRLEPLSRDHAGPLLEAGEGFDWEWMSVHLSALDRVNEWIEEALEAQERGAEFPFVVLSQQSGRVIGSTRYMGVMPKDRGTEIGWTWYSPDVWGSAVNPESKFLLLGHAFEEWGAIRVQLKTDSNNFHSQRAILKLGAQFEGRLRNHRIRRDGTFRDTMMYSIIDSEWPAVKARLLERIGRLHAGTPPAAPAL
jgi:RimJ/RimL family protein N-acetyltransferase